MAKEQNGGIKRVADAVNPVVGLQKLLSSGLGDIRRIAEGMETLPALLEVLADIDKRVASMESEVRRMREGVDDLGELRSLQGSIEDLQRPLAEMSASLHPLQRIGGRLRRRDGEAVELEDGLDPEAEPSGS